MSTTPTSRQRIVAVLTYFVGLPALGAYAYHVYGHWLAPIVTTLVFACVWGFATRNWND